MKEMSLYRYIEVLKNDGMSVRLFATSADGGEVSGEELSEILRSTTVSGLYCDSRKCRAGGVFFCKGRHFSDEYMYEALKKGVCAVIYGVPLSENDGKTASVSEESRTAAAVKDIVREGRYVGRVFIETENVRRAMAVLAAFHYGYPMNKMITVAVTGTKGKTGTVLGISRALNENPSFKAIILNDAVSNGGLTTPEPIELHKAAAKCAESRATHLICEISSQGVKDLRTYGIVFDVACFLNFGQDHISPFEHSTPKDYFDSKARLFSFCRRVVVNFDSERAGDIIKTASEGKYLSASPLTGKKEIYTFSVRSACGDTDFSAVFEKSGESGELIRIKEGGNGGEYPLYINAVGEFNAQNALAVYSVCRILGASPEEIFRGVLFSKPSGRMEILDTADGRVRVIVDYAHNKMSFEALFGAVRRMYSYSPPKITAVFGCSGEKAYGRRYDLPEVALKYSDRIIICEEDSGGEPFEQIKNDIISSIKAILLKKVSAGEGNTEISVIKNRGAAIFAAVSEAFRSREGRVILFTGKGDETVMRRKGGVRPTVSDIILAKRAIKRYDGRLSSDILFSGLCEKAGKRFTVSLENDADIIAGFAVSAKRFLKMGIAVTAVCGRESAEALREMCLKSGLKCLFFDCGDTDLQYTANGEIAFNTAESGALSVFTVNKNEKTASAEISVREKSDALVYLTRSGGILLNGRVLRARISEKTAAVIAERIESEYLMSALKAISGGVKTVTVADGREKNALELCGIGRSREATVIKKDGSER